MEQTGVIVGTLPNGKVQVEIQRKAACASDCEKCGGCAHPDQVMVVEAPNNCGAKVGERVMIRAQTRSILSIAVLVYLMPIALMIGCYFLPIPGGEGVHILGSLAGLALGVAVCVAYSRKAKKQQTVFFEIEKAIMGR